MRNITAIAVALGFFLAASTPSFAATADTATIELAAAKKKVDCTDPKNAKNKACKAKMDKTDLGSISFAAAKKKVDCKDQKNADNKACQSKMDKK